MAKIIDPDLLVVNTEIVIDTAALTFQLIQAGNLVAKDGAAGQAVYSKFVDLWTTTAYNKYPFPAYVIGDPRAGMFVFGFDGATYNGWKPADDTTRTYMRDIGWGEYDAGGAINREYVGAVSQGAVSTGAQLFFQKTSTGASADFTFTDAANEGIQVFGDATNGNFDNRTFFKVFAREYQYKYASADLALVNETATGAYKIGFPVAANELDLKITDVDGTVSGATDPWQELSIKYFSGAFSIDVDSVGAERDFGIVVDIGTHSGIDGSMTASGTVLTSAEGSINLTAYDGGTLTVHEGTNKGTYAVTGTTATTVTINSATFTATETASSFTLQRSVPITATKAQIYTWVHYQLRQASNINTVAGAITGNTADELMLFAGDQLEAGKVAPANANGGGTGVFIAGFNGVQAEDVTTIDFYDNVDAKRTFPFIATGTYAFNSFLTTGGTGYYITYFQYTVKNLVTDMAFSGSAGATASMDSAGSNLPALAQNDYIYVSGAANSVNNGIWQVTDAAPTGLQADVTKIDGDLPTDETAFSAVLGESPYGSPSAAEVNDKDGSPLSGTISAASINVNFAYDSNVQDGRTSGEDAPIVIVAGNAGQAKPVVATGVIGGTTGQSFTLTAEQDRGYSNP